MTLARRPEALPALLAELSELIAEGKAQYVRVRLRDGTQLQGELDGASTAELSLLVGANEQLVHVEVGQIARLDIAGPNRGREWTLAVGGIAGATGALVGWAALPWTDPPHGVLNAFMGLFVASAAVFAVVKRRTALGAWLRRWRTVYDAGAT